MLGVRVRVLSFVWVDGWGLRLGLGLGYVQNVRPFYYFCGLMLGLVLGLGCVQNFRSSIVLGDG